MSFIRRTNSKKDHTQHFIQGIGDGNLFSNFDLPPPDSNLRSRNYIRTSQHDYLDGRRFESNRNKRQKDNLSGADDVDDRKGSSRDNVARRNDVVAAEDFLNENDADGSSSSSNNTWIDGDGGGDLGQVDNLPPPSLNILFQNPMLVLLVSLSVFLLLLLLAVTFRRRSYKKKGSNRSSLPRTESQALRKKKKTDEWEDELDTEYSDLITRRHSIIGETNVHDNVLEINGPSSPLGCYRRESYLRTDHARQRKVGGLLDSRHILPNISYHDVNAQEDAIYHRMAQVSSFDNDYLDEEALSPIGRSRALSLDDFEHTTPTVTGARKPIYVSTFSELTMPDLSIHASQSEDNVSISDGNAKIVEDDTTTTIASVHSQECANSGETEGANGLIHKRRDLTACSDAASSLHSPIAYSDLTMNHLIGGGGFGQVWSATWRGTPVAVKVLSASSESLMVQKAILQEFVAEINMLSGMRHPNICLYIGACLEPSNRAIVTELAANGSLWDALRLPLKAPFAITQERGQPIWPLELYSDTDFTNELPPENCIRPPEGTWPWSLVRRVAEGAARGMNYLHCGKPAVLHRDLKSANILLDDSYNPKVCDFGLSRIKTHENSMTANCGTVQWMAPEILANEPYAEPADVYSYGIILWELLTRRCPYEGMNSIQCAMAVLNKDLRPEIPGWCPATFANLIRQCIDKEPSNRPTFIMILSKLDKMPKS